MKNKILTMLLSIVIAFGLWVYVVTVITPEFEDTFHDIPVVLDGQSILDDRDLMIISDTKLTVDLKLSGYRTDLNKLDSSNITILADLSQITQAGEHNVRYSISYPGSIQSGTIEVLNQDPQYLTVVVVERARKEIPVKIDFVGAVPEGYSADLQNTVLDHTTVTVSGPKDAVDQIDHAMITVDLTDRKSTVVDTFPHVLCDVAGTPVEDINTITVNVSEIRATVKIHQIKEIPVILPLNPGGGITSKMIHITAVAPNDLGLVWLDQDRIRVGYVTLSGSESTMAGLGDAIVLDAIELGELTEDTILKFQIPDMRGLGIEVVAGVTEFEVAVDMPEMGKKTFTVTNFFVDNVPANKKVEIKTNRLNVEIRGPLELLEKLNAENIVAIVDCQNVSLPDSGNITLEAIIEIKSMEGVGAVGEYSISVYVGTVLPSGSEG